ncbi:hypothetical protein BKA62DRAFT_413922 [Auriculariales sp. MPI-PUGE-AT-0066]|nr:hypothetical protein BKA62DRAFT_413922 [Auriculariales sp. MPI-PUGE-AT-0066]
MAHVPQRSSPSACVVGCWLAGDERQSPCRVVRVRKKSLFSVCRCVRTAARGARNFFDPPSAPSPTTAAVRGASHSHPCGPPSSRTTPEIPSARSSLTANTTYLILIACGSSLAHSTTQARTNHEASVYSCRVIRRRKCPTAGFAPKGVHSPRPRVPVRTDSSPHTGRPMEPMLLFFRRLNAQCGRAAGAILLELDGQMP